MKTSEHQTVTAASRARKLKLRHFFDQMAPMRDQWIERNRYYYEQDTAYMKFLVPDGARVLDIGCGTGQMLQALSPSNGVGMDISREMVGVARRDRDPRLTFLEGDIEDVSALEQLRGAGPFDVVVMSDTVGYLEDCLGTLASLHALCGNDTRVIVSYYSHLWEPLLGLATRIGRRMPGADVNWLSSDDIVNLLGLAGFELVAREWRQLLPFRLFGMGNLVNRFIATLPIIRRLCIRHYVVARPLSSARSERPSCSVVIPCRNERGNVEAAVQRLPRFCQDLEMVFVEGGSSDGTWEEIISVQKAHPERRITVLQQPGTGKYDAVKAGFERASGEVLIILDADLTVPPEDIPQFYELLVSRQGDFINGTRMVYGMEQEAMRYLNYWANRVFARIFSFLLNQRFTDTLCGTKALHRDRYQAIADNRHFFGDFDPFGDFDLIFGAAKLNLKIVEVPVHYAARSYGETQISRFRHGLVLLRMVLFAYRKLKAF